MFTSLNTPGFTTCRGYPRPLESLTPSVARTWLKCFRIFENMDSIRQSQSNNSNLLPRMSSSSSHEFMTLGLEWDATFPFPFLSRVGFRIVRNLTTLACPNRLNAKQILQRNGTRRGKLLHSSNFGSGTVWSLTCTHCLGKLSAWVGPLWVVTSGWKKNDKCD